jgi:hypothetical protein
MIWPPRRILKSCGMVDAQQMDDRRCEMLRLKLPVAGIRTHAVVGAINLCNSLFTFKLISLDHPL